MPLLLLLGDNTVEIDEFVRAERAHFQAEDIVTLDGPTLPLPTLAEASLTAGLFAPQRLVIVDRLQERFKGTKQAGESQEITTIMTNIAPTTTLIVVAADIEGDHALAKAVQSAGGTVRTYTTPKRRQLPQWIVQRARAHDATIDRAAADLLANLIGAQPQRLDSELEKLATYVGPGETIGVTSVEALVEMVPQDTVFSLIDAVALGDRSRAAGLLHEQLSRASAAPMEFALQLIRLLARQMRILLRLQLTHKSGKPVAETAKSLRIPPYYLDRYVRQASRFSEASLRGSFEALAALEQALKTGKTEPAVGLDLLISDLCA